MGDIDPKAIAAFLLIGLCSPVLSYGAHRLIDRYRTRKAIAFLEADPLVFEGARFRKILTADGVQLMGPGRVESIESGRVLAASSDGSVLVPFDPLEFKSAWPHWLAADSEAPASRPLPSGQARIRREEPYS